MELKHASLGDGVWSLSAHGEMDLYNADEFKGAIDHLFDRGAMGIVADLAELRYIDSSGVGALLYTFTQCKSRQVAVCFANVKGSVRTVLELTSLFGFLPIADSTHAAVERVGATTSHAQKGDT